MPVCDGPKLVRFYLNAFSADTVGRLKLSLHEFTFGMLSTQPVLALHLLACIMSVSALWLYHNMTVIHVDWQKIATNFFMHIIQRVLERT